MTRHRTGGEADAEEDEADLLLSTALPYMPAPRTSQPSQQQQQRGRPITAPPFCLVRVLTGVF